MGEIAFYVLACAARGTIRLFRVSISLFILREFLWLEDKRERERGLTFPLLWDCLSGRFIARLVWLASALADAASVFISPFKTLVLTGNRLPCGLWKNRRVEVTAE